MAKIHTDEKAAQLIKEVDAQCRQSANLNNHESIEHKLKNSELRYRRLFEAAQDGILILDVATAKIIDVNPFLVSMLGYSKEEFLGKRLWELSSFKDIELTKSAFKELQAKKYIRYEDLPLETKDGYQIAVEFVSNIYSVGEDNVIQCNIRDITERRRAEEAREESRRVHEEHERRAASGRRS